MRPVGKVAKLALDITVEVILLRIKEVQDSVRVTIDRAAILLGL